MSVRICLCILAAAEILAAHGRAAPQTVPFQLQDNLVHVPAHIDGQSVSAVLDSGTGQVLLDNSAASRLRVVPAGAGVSGLGGGVGVQPAVPLALDNVDAGPVHLTDVQAFAMDLQPFTRSAGFQIDAILGAPVLMSQVVEVDYPHRQVRFLSPTEPAPCPDPIPIRLVAGVPVAAVTLRANRGAEPVTLHLIVDLGTRHFAALVGGSFLESDIGRGLFLAGRPTEIGTGTGGQIHGSTAEIEALTLGAQSFHHLRIAFTKEVKAFQTGIADGTLGVPLWADGVITFDYPHQRLCLNVS